MKYKTLLTASLIGMAVVTTGCSDYLDSDYLFKERMSIQDVFSNRDYTNEWLATAYSYMATGYVQDLPSKYYLPTAVLKFGLTAIKEYGRPPFLLSTLTRIPNSPKASVLI